MPARTVLSLLAPCLFLAAGALFAGDGPALVSSMGLTNATMAVGGISIVPATDVAPPSYTEDLAPPQVLEIIRPDMAPLSVGRLLSSCTCVQASMTQKDFAAGERAFLTIRNVKKTPASGATYAIFVQLAAPVRETLQYDIFVKSGAGGVPAAKPLPPPPPPSYDAIAPYAPKTR